MKLTINNVLMKCVYFLVLILSVYSIADAMPPHPDLLKKAKVNNSPMPYFYQNLAEMHRKGICTGENIYEEIYFNAKQSVGNSLSLSGDFNVLAILVEFSDELSSTAPYFFDSLIFDSNGITIKDYFKDISGGQLDIVTVNLPSTVGWVTAPQTYAYYVNNVNGTGSYPRNTQGLTEDLVDALDSLVDFSIYDNDKNGVVDYLIIIHPRQGAEVTASNQDIWSHKWGIVPKLTNDSVYVSNFTIQPEYITTLGDMTIGSFAHMIGHAYGLPDLYDTDGSSYGIGKWGVMGYGSWLGPNGKGGSPSHPCAWSKIKLGVKSAVNIEASVDALQIENINTTGEIYRVWTKGAIGDEYYLLENRQKVGYDSYLPNSGLLIWHIDDSKSNNTQEWTHTGLTSNYMVALEQADGLFNLENRNNLGDNNDPFPGGLGTDVFHSQTTPSSDSYQDSTSQITIDNITEIYSTIIADIKIMDCCSGIRGNMNGDSLEQIDISDLVFFVTYFFNGGDIPSCLDEVNVDGAVTGNIAVDISDIVIFVDYMFYEGDAPADCP